MDIIKAKSDQNTHNGRSIIKTGIGFQTIDTSKDTEPDFTSLQNLNNFNFDDQKYALIGTIENVVTTPQPTRTPTRTPTPSITNTSTTTPSTTNTITPTPTNTVSQTSDSFITPTLSNTQTPTPTPTPAASPLFVASIYNSSINANSSDGSLWNYSNFTNSRNWNSLAYGNNQYLATAYNTSSYNISTDGTNWTDRSYDISHPNNLFNKNIYAGGKYLIFANSSVGLSSEDALSWSSFVLPSANWSLSAYGNNTYVALISGSSVIATSSDAITWTQRSLPVSRSWSDVIYANNQFVLIANNSDTVLYSSDGISWNTSSLPQSGLWRCLSYGNGLYVALIYQSSTIAYSSDAVSWSIGTGLPYSWRDLTYGNNTFVAIGTGAVVMTSSNGTTWTQRAISNNNWNTIVFSS